MDDRSAVEMVRRIRLLLGLRQQDVALAAASSRSTISRIERGELDGVTVGTLRALSRALRMPPVVSLGWRGADVAELLDEGHAALVERVVAVLRREGWETVVEYSFSHYGERGRVDVVGWHAASGSLLLVEVKTRIVDLQDLFGSMHRMRRLVPALLAEECGWAVRSIGELLVVPDTSSIRRTIVRHGASFDAALPQRTVDVRRWVEAPRGDLRGIWFLSDSRQLNPAIRAARPRPPG